METVKNVPGQYQFTRTYQWRIGYADAIMGRDCAEDATREYYDGFSKGKFDDDFVNGQNSSADSLDY